MDVALYGAEWPCRTSISKHLKLNSSTTMELMVWLLLSTTALIASASSYQSKPSYVIPNVSKREFFLNGSLNGNKYFEKHCNCTIDRTSHEYFLVNCSSSAGKTDCPKDTILVEYSPASGYKLPIPSRVYTKSVTTATTETLPTTESTDNVTATETPKSPTEKESNNPFWIIIGGEFVVIVVLVACLLRRKLYCLRSTIKLKSAQILKNDNQELITSPVEEVVELPPRAGFQHPPPPAEAVYEVNTNYGEMPTVRRAKVPVYEDHRFDKNDPRTHQHNVYAKALDQEEGSESLYSTINEQEC